MSSNQKERIKGLHVKIGSQSYSPLMPFGSDGQLIDMISSLDLEQELKLGGNHYVELEEDDDNDVLIIKEWYYTQPKENKTRAEMSQFCTHSVVISFIENTAATAIDVGQGDVLVDEQENGNLIVIEDDQIQSEINISLYKGDLEENNSVLLHTKRIIINPPNANKIEIAQEDMDIIEEGGN